MQQECILMSTSPLQKRQKQRHLQQQQLLSLLRECASASMERIPPDTEWLTTRQLADALGLSIYKTRHLLLDLVSQGHVVAINHGHGARNGWRWYLAPHQDAHQ
ncbi:hypothetical protein AR325_25675 (plasmid) [Serratia marcescens]|nr:hypothetical protein AR325_25675 [Serratia marcescens]